MNKTVIGVAAIIAAASVAAFYVWSSYNRYYIMTSSKGTAYQVDRKTGKSWLLKGTTRFLLEDPKPELPLPFAEQEKITGYGSISMFGNFSGEIYNGTSWEITRIVINVTAEEEDGSVRWTRDFSENISISPLETQHFSVELAGEYGVKKAPWYLKKVYGYKK